MIVGHADTLGELFELCDQTLGSVTGVGLHHRGDRWRLMLIVALVETNERLHSVKLLLEADHVMKTTPADEGLVLDMLIADLASTPA